MKKSICTLCAAAWIILTAGTPAQAATAAKEYLTPKEIEQIQDAQEIEKRIKIYLEAAALRLKAAEDRLYGKESAPGDPLEFFSAEEMIDGYYQIVRSVMLNLDGAFQKPSGDKEKFGVALKNLKDSMEKAEKSLAILKKMAEEKRREELWNLINKAIDVTGGAHEGAEMGLSKQPAPPKKKGK
jgi:hypothetical protein